MKKHLNSARRKFTTLGQLRNLILPNLVSSLTKEHKPEGRARTFSHWSHVVALILGRLSHAIGLNDLHAAEFISAPPPKTPKPQEWDGFLDIPFNARYP